MLTKGENLVNFQTLKLMSTMNLIPIEIDMVTGKIRTQSKLWRVILWQVAYGLSMLQWVYSNLRFLQALAFPEYFVLKHFVIHLVILGGLWNFNFFGLHMFILHPDDTIKVFNELFLEDGDVVLTERPPRRLLDFKYSRLEFVILVMPIMYLEVSLSICLFLVVGVPHLHLLYSIFPTTIQAPLFWPLYPIEFYFVWFYVGLGFISYVYQELFFLKAAHILTSFIQEVKNLETDEPTVDSEYGLKLEELLKKMYSVFCFVHLFNNCTAYCIFSNKLMCISLAIFCGFFTIHEATSNVPVALFCVAIFVETIILFGLIYERAFFIPGHMDDFKKELSVAVAKVRTLTTRMLMQRQLKAIPNVAIRIGSFHTLERESTPVFIDFVFSNIASLLLTYQ